MSTLNESDGTQQASAPAHDEEFVRIARKRFEKHPAERPSVYLIAGGIVGAAARYCRRYGKWGLIIGVPSAAIAGMTVSLNGVTLYHYVAATREFRQLDDKRLPEAEQHFRETSSSPEEAQEAIVQWRQSQSDRVRAMILEAFAFIIERKHGQEMANLWTSHTLDYMAAQQREQEAMEQKEELERAVRRAARD